MRGEVSPLEAGVSLEGDMLDLTLRPGDHAFIRRSSLVRATGDFDLKTVRIQKRRVSIYALFSSEVRWANRFDAKSAPVSLLAARDFPGRIVRIHVLPERPIHIQPRLYLGHRGELSFDMRRVARREFWTMTKVAGTGTVWIKLPGRPRLEALREDGEIVDSNYVSAVMGPFKADGKVFTAGAVLRSGEMENVRLSGSGYYVLQSENPEEGAAGSDGGLIGNLFQLLPF